MNHLKLIKRQAMGELGFLTCNITSYCRLKAWPSEDAGSAADRHKHSPQWETIDG